jgi:AraC-like DNA-binding protein
MEALNQKRSGLKSEQLNSNLEITIPYPPLQISQGKKSIRDYNLYFDLIKFDLKDELIEVFPPIGYLVGNLFIGESVKCNFINYNNDRFYSNQLYVTGLFSRGSMFFSVKNKGQGYAFRIHPVIGYHFLKISMTELVDRQIRVSDVLQMNNALLRKLEHNERIESIDNKFFQQILWEMLPEKCSFLDDPIYHAVNNIIANRGNVRIQNLASACYMSERTLRRHFLRKVGLSPQAYARIWKINHAIDFIQKNPTLSLEEVAWRIGYYDVAHLSHDFKSMVKIPPSMVNKNLGPLATSYLNNNGIVN